MSMLGQSNIVSVNILALFGDVKQNIAHCSWTVETQHVTFIAQHFLAAFIFIWIKIDLYF